MHNFKTEKNKTEEKKKTLSICWFVPASSSAEGSDTD